MKVLITTGIFEPESGGPATYTAQIAKELISRGHSVDVVTFSDEASYDFDDKFNFSLTRVIRKNKISNYVRMFFILLRHIGKYDFIYTLDWLSVGLPLSLAAFLKRKKYIIRIGGGYIWERYLLLGLPPMSLRVFYEKGVHKKYPAFFILIKFVFRRASGIIFNSIKQRELFAKYYKLDTNKLFTIFNPVPEDLLDIKRGIPSKEIIFAGRYIVMKNISSIIKAFHKANLRDHTLILIGDGPTLDKMKDLALSFNLGERIQFLPRMRKREVFERAKDARYLIVPSWTDIQPMQFYESVAVGVPVLITKENYLDEYDKIPMKINPHSVDDIAEKMVALSNDETYKGFAKQFADIKVKRGWKEVADMHLEIFKKII